jgi:hypothetical protein
MTKFGLLGAIFAGAMTVGSATFCQASTINFDDVSAPLSGAGVTSYLSGYGITYTGAGTPYILAYIAGGNPFFPVSAPNYFAVGGTAWTLSFSDSLNAMSFTVPGTGNSSTMAAWSATAYSAANVQLDQVGNPFITGFNSSAHTYTLTGPDIAYVVFSETVGSAGNYLAFDNLTIVATPLPAALPLFATGLGALGLLGWRRKRKQVA